VRYGQNSATGQTTTSSGPNPIKCVRADQRERASPAIASISHPEAEDVELRAALDETVAMAEQFAPTVILLTAGGTLAHSSVSFGGPPPTK